MGFVSVFSYIDIKYLHHKNIHERILTMSAATGEVAVRVMISKFKVANGMEAQVADAFRNRPHLVDDAPGFLGLEVLQPASTPGEFWLLTRWTDEEAFQTCRRRHLQASHAGVPRGLKLDPSATQLMAFEQLCA